MTAPLAVHVAAGAVALATGFLALGVAKGGTVHRRSGQVFVVAMLIMAGLGGAISVARGGGAGTGAIVTCYFVITALVTVHRPAFWSRRLDVALMALALGIGLVNLWAGVAAARSPSGRLNGLPPFPFIMFGVVSLVAARGDWQVLRAGPRTGSARLARHLWRMCWALWVASGSFFLGQMVEFPAALRRPELLAVPALLPLLVMPYFLWRVRARRRARTGVPVGATAAAGEA